MSTRLELLKEFDNIRHLQAVEILVARLRQVAAEVASGSKKVIVLNPGEDLEMFASGPELGRLERVEVRVTIRDFDNIKAGELT